MRPINQARTTRVGVAETQDVSRLSVAAPSPTQVQGSSSGRAQALSQALGLGQQFGTNLKNEREKLDTEAGNKAFALGNVDEELRKRSEAFDRAVTLNETEANWIIDVDEFDETLREADLDSLEPEEQLDALNASIDELFQAKYGGLDDENAAEVLLPRMEKFRADKVNELLGTQRAQFEERNDANLQIAVRGFADAARAQFGDDNPDVPEFARTAAASFDYQGLQQRIRALKPGGATNETYFAVLKDIAVRTGDPDLLTNLPAKWADGTPTFKSIPAFNDQLLSAEQQAINVRNANENRHNKATIEERKARETAIANEGYAKALLGEDPQAFMLEQVADGAIDGKTANSVQQAFRSAQTFSADRPVDPNALAQLQADVLFRPEAITDDALFTAWGDGVFGDPRQGDAAEALRQMIKDRDQARAASASVASNPRAQSAISRFKTSFSPKTDALGNFLGDGQVGERMFFAETLDGLKNDLASGTDPADAFRNAEESYLSRINAIREQETLDQDLDSVFTRVVSGTTSPANAILGLKSAGTSSSVIAEDIGRRVGAGALPIPNARALLIELNR